GALYHQFEDKRALFEAVYVEVEAELTLRIAEGALGGEITSPMAAMRAGADQFLDACTEPQVQRIALLDGPSALGWDGWRAIGAEYGLGLIEASLMAAIDAGELSPRPVRPLAHILLGALDEAAMLVARSEDQERSRVEVGQTLDAVLSALGR